MAITDYTLRFESKFVCPTEASSGVRDKRAHQHTPMPWSRTPHVIVEAFIGTHDDAVNRTRAYGYQGHVPEAPCLLGADKTALYRQASRDVDWGERRYIAMCKASLIIGLSVTLAACFPLLACAVAMKLGFSVGLTWGMAIYVLSSAYLSGAAGGAAYEARWYANAKIKFDAMATLSEGYAELQRDMLSEARIAQCEAIVQRSFLSSEWGLRQATLEYEAELRHKRPNLGQPETEQKAA